MNNKLFMGLLVTALVVAIGVGGAFAGGVAYGRNQEDAAPVVTTPDLPSPSAIQAQLWGGQSNSEGLAELRARLQSGNTTPEDLQHLRQQFAGQAGRFGGGGNFRFGGGGFNGTIESIEGNTITMNTQQGPLQVTLSGETTVTSIVLIEASDLTLEARIAVTGQRNEEGFIEANSITITPEGLDLGGPRGLFRGSGRDSSAPITP